MSWIVKGPACDRKTHRCGMPVTPSTETSRWWCWHTTSLSSSQHLHFRKSSIFLPLPSVCKMSMIAVRSKIVLAKVSFGIFIQLHPKIYKHYSNRFNCRKRFLLLESNTQLSWASGSTRYFLNFHSTFFPLNKFLFRHNENYLHRKVTR